MEHRSIFGIRGAGLFVVLASLLSACSGGNAPSLPGAPVSAYQALSRERTTPAFYVSDLSTSATIYATDANPSDPQPLAVLTQEITRSGGIWVDGKGTTYVVNECCAYPAPYVSIVEFKRGQTTPSLRIVDGLNQPGAVAVSSDGTLYVNDIKAGTNGTGAVEVYKPGKTSPERTITLPDPQYALTPGSIVFDAKGDVLVATLNDENDAVKVFRIAPGSSKPVDTGIQGAAGESMGIDAAGYLYMANAPSTRGTVTVYAPGATEPTRTYSLGPQIAGIAVARDGTLYATTAENLGILEVAPGGATAEKTFKAAGAGIALGRY